MSTYTWIGSAKRTPGAADSSMLLEVRRRALQSQGAIHYRAVNPTKPIFNYPVIPYFTNNEDTYSEKRIDAQGNALTPSAWNGIADFAGAAPINEGVVTPGVSILYGFLFTLPVELTGTTFAALLQNIPTTVAGHGAAIGMNNIVFNFTSSPAGLITPEPTPVVPTSTSLGPTSFEFNFDAGTSPVASFEGQTITLTSASPLTLVSVQVDVLYNL